MMIFGYKNKEKLSFKLFLRILPWPRRDRATCNHNCAQLRRRLVNFDYITKTGKKTSFKGNDLLMKYNFDGQQE